MLETRLKTLVDPLMSRMGRRAAELGARADSVTWAALGFMAGAAGCVLIGWSWIGLIFLLAAGFCDGLDGAVARATVGTDRGGFLNDSLRFAAPPMIPLAFAIHDPARNALAAAILVGFWGIWSATTLAYDLHAARRAADRAGFRSDHAVWPIRRLEGWLTFLGLGALCLAPGIFPWMAGLCAFLLLAASVSRFLDAMEKL